MINKETLQRLHRKRPRPAYESAASIVVFFSLSAISTWGWGRGWWPITFGFWLVQAHVGHAILLAFHEAAHYTLHPKGWRNELQGIAVGSLILTPLSAFRWVHNQHHLHLGSLQDAELWPFVIPQTPRWQRIVAAAAELIIGFFYSPIIFLHGVLVAKRMPRATARRLALEYAVCVFFWVTILTTIFALGVVPEFVIGYLIPAILAGNLQSLRKFTEHMGLLGDDVPSTTRTVVDRSLRGRVLSAAMLHIDLHGPHHLYPKIPHFGLPEATLMTYQQELLEPESANVFPSYFAALKHMVGTLADPRVGSQWRTTSETHQSHS